VIRIVANSLEVIPKRIAVEPARHRRAAGLL